MVFNHLNESAITNEEAIAFNALANCRWEDVIVLIKGTETIPIEDITYKEAMYLIEFQDYTAIPF